MRYAFLYLLFFTGFYSFAGVPVLQTNPVTYNNGDYSSVIGSATILNNGGSPITQSGLVWSTQRHPNVLTNEGLTSDGTTIGNFTSVMTNLSPGTYYFLKPYAINGTDTGYGREIVFNAKKNKWDGVYDLTFSNFHPVYNPNYDGSFTQVELKTTGPNSCKIYWPLAGGYYNPSVLNGGLQYYVSQEPEYTFDTITNKVTVQNASATAVTFYTMNPTFDSHYDTITQKIFCKWGYRYVGGQFDPTTSREWTQEFTRISVVNTSAPAILYSITPSSGTSGTVITVKGMNFSSAFSAYFYKNGKTTNVDSTAVISDSVAKVWVGADNGGMLYMFGDSIGPFNYTAPPVVSTSGWDQLSGPGFIKYPPKLAFDQNNVLFITHRDSATNRLVVKKYNGNTWTSVGTYLSSGIAGNYNILINNSNIPIVSFADSTQGGRITVKGFYGTSWITLGNAAFCSVSSARESYLQSDSLDNLYIYGNNSITNTFNSPVVNLSIPDNNATGISNTIQVSQIPSGVKILGVRCSVNIPHTYSSDLVINLKAPNGKILNLSKFIGGSGTNSVSPTEGFINTTFQDGRSSLLETMNYWSSYSTRFPNAYRPDTINSQLDLTNFPIQNPTGYVSNATGFSDLTSIINGNWSLAIADGKGAWDHGSGISTSDIGKLYSWSISIDYITNNADTLTKTCIYKYAGDGWVDAYPDLIFPDNYYPESFLVDKSSGNPIFSLLSWDNYVSYMTVNGNTNEILPPVYASQDAYPYITRCALDNLKRPIVVFQDDNGFERLSAFRYQNNQWTRLGSAMFGKSRVHYYQLITDKNSTPYIYFVDEGYNNMGTILRYNEATNTWEQIGNRGFVATYTTYSFGNFYTGMVFDTTGIPYIGYADSRYGNRGSILKRQVPATSIEGSFTTALGDSIPNVTVKLTGSSITETISTNRGKYSLMGYTGGNYQLTPSKNNDLNRTNGVSTLDILKVQSHILHIDSLNSPYKIIAADVNNSGTVTGMDILYMRKLILGMINTFPGDRIWAFVDASQTFADDYNPFPFNYFKSYSSLGTSTNQNFKGIKLGDVTYDWNPNVLRNSFVGNIELYTDTVWYNNGDTVRVLFRAKNFDRIKGMQFTIGWDASDLHLVDIGQNPMNIQFGKQRAEDGLLALQWNDLQNRSISKTPGEMLFELKFMKTHPERNNQLYINSIITNNEGYDDALALHEVKLTGGVVTTSKKELTNSETEWSVFPNPARNFIYLNLPSLKNEIVEASLYNQLGFLVDQKTIKLNQGQNVFQWNLQNNLSVNPGTFFLKIHNHQIQKQFKILVIK